MPELEEQIQEREARSCDGFSQGTWTLNHLLPSRAVTPAHQLWVMEGGA